MQTPNPRALPHAPDPRSSRLEGLVIISLSKKKILNSVILRHRAAIFEKKRKKHERELFLTKKQIENKKKTAAIAESDPLRCSDGAKAPFAPRRPCRPSGERLAGRRSWPSFRWGNEVGFERANPVSLVFCIKNEVSARLSYTETADRNSLSISRMSQRFFDGSFLRPLRIRHRPTPTSPTTLQSSFMWMAPPGWYSDATGSSFAGSCVLQKLY